jgi:hypothetical protein
MPNTGNVLTLTLKEVQMPANIPTGNTKPNTPSDPDYIGLVLNTTTCPISFDTLCPVVIATGETTSILFEFSLPNSVVNNPAVFSVRVTALLSAVPASIVFFNLPKTNPNYFAGELTGLTLGNTYTIDIDYLDDTLAVFDSCPTVATITTNSTNPSST